MKAFPSTDGAQSNSKPAKLLWLALSEFAVQISFSPGHPAHEIHSIPILTP